MILTAAHFHFARFAFGAIAFGVALSTGYAIGFATVGVASWRSVDRRTAAVPTDVVACS